MSLDTRTIAGPIRAPRMVRKFAVLMTAAVPASGESLSAEELWSWHAVDLPLLKTPGLEWGLHTRLRTREGEVQQGRSGTIVKFKPHSRFSLIGGYYYGREEDTREEWRALIACSVAPRLAFT